VKITIDCPRENCLINERGKIERTETSSVPIYDGANVVSQATVTKRFYSWPRTG
jgi:hypothetical protein